MVSRITPSAAQWHLRQAELPLDDEARPSIPLERREELKKALIDMLMSAAQVRSGAKEVGSEIAEADS